MLKTTPDRYGVSSNAIFEELKRYIFSMENSPKELRRVHYVLRNFATDDWLEAIDTSDLEVDNTVIITQSELETKWFLDVPYGTQEVKGISWWSRYHGLWWTNERSALANFDILKKYFLDMSKPHTGRAQYTVRTLRDAGYVIPPFSAKAVKEQNKQLREQLKALKRMIAKSDNQVAAFTEDNSVDLIANDSDSELEVIVSSAIITSYMVLSDTKICSQTLKKGS